LLLAGGGGGGGGLPLFGAAGRAGGGGVWGVGGGFSEAFTANRVAVAAPPGINAAGVARIVWGSRDSRSMAQFLALNFAFMAVEFAYGWWSNSLGLISDACHMLFDCAGLCIGLAAHVQTRLKTADGAYTYGYARGEVLAGFLNGVFLVYVAFMVLLEGAERMWAPPLVHSDRLLPVSVLGLLVNLVGVCAFSHAHSHGLPSSPPSCGHNHGGSGGHIHGGGEDSSHDHGHHHTHGGCGGCEGGAQQGSSGGGGGLDSHNLRGVYLHILGMIISALCIHYLLASPHTHTVPAHRS
jgi:zinc transporter 5/7